MQIVQNSTEHYKKKQYLEAPCPSCGGLEGEAIPNGSHLTLRCLCGRFVKHLPQGTKQRRAAAHKNLVEKHDIAECQLCGISATEARAMGTFLHAHHVERYADGGTAEKENVLGVCGPCHDHIHHRQNVVRWWRDSRKLAKLQGKEAP